MTAPATPVPAQPASGGKAAPALGEASPAPVPPAIVLVRPQLGENVGAAARAMLNFGLTDLRLVAPRDGWPNPAAGPAASGADVVLARARVFDSLADALADVGFAYATTVRPRGMTKPVVTPAAAAADSRARAGRTAIVFGPERSGLTTDDLAVAHAVLTVPVNPAFGSLNLAQAVLIAAYEWSLADAPRAAADALRIDNYKGPAPMVELEGLIAQLNAALDATGYYRVPSRRASSLRTTRNLLTRPAYSAGEVRTWRGIVSALVKGRERP